MRAAVKRRRPVLVQDQRRIGAVFHINHHKASIAPRAIGGVTAHRCVVQSEPLIGRPGNLFARSRVHAIEPKLARWLWVGWVGHINRHKNIIGKAVEQHRHIGPATARIPDTMHATAIHRHEADLLRLFRIFDVVNG